MTYPAGTASTPEHSATCCDPSWSEDFCQSGGGLNQVDPCAHNAGSCCGGAGTDDVQFARDINNFMKSACFGPSTASLNTESIFSTGFSNGGMMTNRLGCEAADLYAGIAPQAGNIMTQRFGDFQACNPSRPISYLGFCGTNDGVCIGTFNRTTAEWAGHNNCAGETSTTVSTATTTCTRTTNCDGGVIVEQCLIDGLGHEWSGHPRPDGTSSQRPNTDIDSTVYIFDVFSTLL
jgi:polyhydroxybutyrate depolymerase